MFLVHVVTGEVVWY